MSRPFSHRSASRLPNSKLAVDGVFGPDTLASVRQLQTALGLTVDGIAGPVLWSYLVNGRSRFLKMRLGIAWLVVSVALIVGGLLAFYLGASSHIDLVRLQMGRLREQRRRAS